MRKGRQRRAALLGPANRDVPETFFRLCHYCLFLNESENEIQQCSRCERKFSPSENDFSSDADERLLDQQMEEDEPGHDQSPPQKRANLTGLNVKW